jgi:hypothetical protein
MACLGLAVLTYCILLGVSNGYRILPSVQLWIVLATIDPAYMVVASSWLLYGISTVVSYPTVFHMSFSVQLHGKVSKDQTAGTSQKAAFRR